MRRMPSCLSPVREYPNSDNFWSEADNEKSGSSRTFVSLDSLQLLTSVQFGTWRTSSYSTSKTRTKQCLSVSFSTKSSSVIREMLKHSQHIRNRATLSRRSRTQIQKRMLHDSEMDCARKQDLSLNLSSMTMRSTLSPPLLILRCAFTQPPPVSMETPIKHGDRVIKLEGRLHTDDTFC